MYSGGIFDWEEALRHLHKLKRDCEAENLWENAEQARYVLQTRARLEEDIGKIEALEKNLEECLELLILAESEGDEGVRQETEEELYRLRRESLQLSRRALLCGEVDENDCYLEVNAGAGGTEAQDWAQMLLRMYIHWSGRRGYRVELLSESLGEEAGIKSSVIQISGPYAYGWLQTESGIHRLVRQSPFNSLAKRHTSFASVYVSPVLDDRIQIEINEGDLRIDTYRASGAGGQHVNRTDSAVRMTHLPTKIVVQCQQERSQHQNRARAMSMLRARLYQVEQRKREQEAAEKEAQKSDIAWGYQIRSYVLHPYQMIKDLRTQSETSDTQGVLDGDIDVFLEAALDKLRQKSHFSKARQD